MLPIFVTDKDVISKSCHLHMYLFNKQPLVWTLSRTVSGAGGTAVNKAKPLARVVIILRFVAKNVLMPKMCLKDVLL